MRHFDRLNALTLTLGLTVPLLFGYLWVTGNPGVAKQEPIVEVITERGVFQKDSLIDRGKAWEMYSASPHVFSTPSPLPRPTQLGCEDHFGGVGIDYDPETRIIENVRPGLAADQAQLKVGDKILGPAPGDIAGPAGTLVTVVVEREGKILSYTMTRVEVCR